MSEWCDSQKNPKGDRQSRYKNAIELSNEADVAETLRKAAELSNLHITYTRTMRSIQVLDIKRKYTSILSGNKGADRTSDLAYFIAPCHKLKYPL